MILFYLEQKFIIRFWNYVKYNLIWIAIVYLIFSLSYGKPNPLQWDIIGLKYIFGIYILYVLIPPFFRTKKYIEKLEYSISDKTFIVTINIYNNKNIYKVNVEVFSIELCIYDVQTRTKNLYLKISEKDNCIVKQFDYTPWTQDKMKEIVNKIKDIKEI